MTKVHILSAHFNLLPYHAARYDGFLKQHGQAYRLTSLLLRPTKEYRLFEQRHGPDNHFAIRRLPADSSAKNRVPSTAIGKTFDEIAPDLVILPGGYAERETQCVIHHAARRRVPLVLCSATKADDSRRSWWKEAVKRSLMRRFSSFLVGGTPQSEYIASLGGDPRTIATGYDAVDNEYFATRSSAARDNPEGTRASLGLPERFFLASMRFVEVKNLPFLLEAYARYRILAKAAPIAADTTPQWDLVLLGDGPLKASLVNQCATLGIAKHVLMPGFKQYEDIPEYYATAKALILPSKNETWGLVVNEAMACGLPVLVSNRCGCAVDLVHESCNGFVFDPTDVGQLAEHMLRIASLRADQWASMSQASRRIIANWGPNRFAAGLKMAVDAALSIGPRQPSLLDRLILETLMRR